MISKNNVAEENVAEEKDMPQVYLDSRSSLRPQATDGNASVG